MTVYRYNPGWAVSVDATSTDRSVTLTAGDMAILFEAAGRLGLQPEDPSRIEAPDLPYRMEIPLAEFKSVSRFRATKDVSRSVARLATARNNGVTCFGRVAVEGDVVAFEVVHDAAFLRSRMVYAPLISAGTSQRYTQLDPTAMGGFKSSFSAPVLSRVRSWLDGATKQGLRKGEYEFDRNNHLTLTLPPYDVGARLGIDIVRPYPAFLGPILQRIAKDLAQAHVQMRVGERTGAGGRVIIYALRFDALRPQAEWDFEEHRDHPEDGHLDSLKLRRIGKASPIATPAPPSEPIPSDDDIEEHPDSEVVLMERSSPYDGYPDPDPDRDEFVRVGEAYEDADIDVNMPETAIEDEDVEELPELPVLAALARDDLPEDEPEPTRPDWDSMPDDVRRKASSAYRRDMERWRLRPPPRVKVLTPYRLNPHEHRRHLYASADFLPSDIDAYYPFLVWHHGLAEPVQVEDWDQFQAVLETEVDATRQDRRTQEMCDKLDLEPDELTEEHWAQYGGTLAH